MMMNGRRFWIAALSFIVLFAVGCRKVEETVPATPAPLVSIALRPTSPGMAPGTSMQLDAIGTYENGTTKSLTASVTWQSADPGVASVSTSGLVTAAIPGTTTITATSGSITGSTLLTASPLVSLSLSPADPTIAAGTTVQLSATGTLSNGSTQVLTSFVTWSSSNTTVATIAGSGLASALTTTGSTNITASFDTVTGTTTLTSADLTSISVAPLTASIILGTSQQFTATGLLVGGFTQNLTSAVLWSSSSPTIAVIGSTIASPGLAVSVAPGSTAITASFNGRTSNVAALTVEPATLVSITVAPANASIAVGDSQQFTATGVFSDGTSHDVTAAATWTSSNPLVVSVSNALGTKGQASGVAVGSASVSATFSGVTSNSATVTVTPTVLVSITVSPANSATVVGSGRQFTAQGKFSDGTTQDITNTVTWSATIGIAFISNATGSKGQLNALGAGTATVTATLGSVSNSTTLTITNF